MSKLPLCSLDGKKLGEFDLSDDLLIFDKGLTAMHEAVVAYRTNRRAGTASTLGKGQVAGSNKKPWKQKGTGNARAGYRQSPIWRGGGVAFGPKPRNFSKSVNKKASRLAFKRAFSEKVAAGSIRVLDKFELAEPKTKFAAQVLKQLKVEGRVLLVLDQVDAKTRLATRNLATCEVTSAENVNTYQLLRYPSLLINKAGMEILQKRLQKAGGKKA